MGQIASAFSAKTEVLSVQEALKNLNAARANLQKQQSELNNAMNKLSKAEEGDANTDAILDAKRDAVTEAEKKVKLEIDAYKNATSSYQKSRRAEISKSVAPSQEVKRASNNIQESVFSLNVKPAQNVKLAVPVQTAKPAVPARNGDMNRNFLMSQGMGNQGMKTQGMGNQGMKTQGMGNQGITNPFSTKASGGRSRKIKLKLKMKRKKRAKSLRR